MSSSKKTGLNRAFFVGLFLLGLGLYYFFEIWVYRPELVPLSGAVRYANISYRTEKNGVRGASILMSYLSISLKQHPQQFCLRGGEDVVGEEHYRILESVRQADSLTIFVDKKELEAQFPIVYQIENRQKVELFNYIEWQKARMGWLVFFMMVIGTGLTLQIFIPRPTPPPRKGRKSKKTS